MSTAPAKGALFPPDELEVLLILKAKQRQAISYGAVFAWFGLPFQRFRVGQLCASLAEVDSRQQGLGQPELAVLVVRQSDGLPGQGWWLGRSKEEWSGAFVGPEAQHFVEAIQNRTFDWWEERDG